MAEFNLSIKNAIEQLDTLIKKFNEVNKTVGTADYKALENSAKRIADVHEQSLQALKNVHLELKSSKNLYKSVTDVVNKNGAAIKRATAAIKSKFQQVKELLSIYKRQISESKSLAKSYKELTTEISFVKKELSFYTKENEKLIRSNKKGGTTYKNNIKAITILSERLKVINKIKSKTVTVSEKEIAVRKVLDGERHKAIATSKKLLDNYNKENVENNKAVEQYKKLIITIKKLKKEKDRLRGNPKKIAVLTKEITRLEQIQRKTAGTTKKLAYDTQILNRALKKTKAVATEAAGKITQVSASTSTFGSLLRKVFVTVGLYGGLYRLFSVISRAVGVVREFEKGIYTIAGIFRTTREDIFDLENAILNVAKSSIKTVTQVTELAEGLATLGKTKEEIIDLIKPVTDLSIALNTGGKDAGNFLIQVLNSFGATSDEAAKYADTLATIRTSTSLTFQKMRDSFQYLSPISRVLNKDLAYTGALIGILADNGIKAQRAGRLMSSAQQRLAQKGISLAEALQTVNRAFDRGVRGVELLGISTSVFGQEASALGSILALSSEKLETHAQSIRDNDGAIDDLVNQQLKSLDAILLILGARYENFIIKSGKASGAIGFLKGTVIFLTKHLENLLSAIITAGVVFLSWKTLLILARFSLTRLTVSLKLFGVGMLSTITKVRALRFSIKAFSFNLKVLRATLHTARIALIGFLSSTIVGVGLIALGVFIEWVYSAATGTDDFSDSLEKSTKKLKKQSDQAVKTENKLKKLIEAVDKLKTQTDDNVEKQEELVRIFGEINKIVPTAITNINDYNSSLDTEAVENFTKAIKQKNLEIATGERIKLKRKTDDLLWRKTKTKTLENKIRAKRDEFIGVKEKLQTDKQKGLDDGTFKKDGFMDTSFQKRIDRQVTKIKNKAVALTDAVLESKKALKNWQENEDAIANLRQIQIQSGAEPTEEEQTAIYKQTEIDNIAKALEKTRELSNSITKQKEELDKLQKQYDKLSDKKLFPEDYIEKSKQFQDLLTLSQRIEQTKKKIDQLYDKSGLSRTDDGDDGDDTGKVNTFKQDISIAYLKNKKQIIKQSIDDIKIITTKGREEKLKLLIEDYLIDKKIRKEETDKKVLLAKNDEEKLAIISTNSSTEAIKRIAKFNKDKADLERQYSVWVQKIRTATTNNKIAELEIKNIKIDDDIDKLQKNEYGYGWSEVLLKESYSNRRKIVVLEIQRKKELLYKSYKNETISYSEYLKGIEAQKIIGKEKGIQFQIDYNEDIKFLYQQHLDYLDDRIDEGIEKEENASEYLLNSGLVAINDKYRKIAKKNIDHDKLTQKQAEEKGKEELKLQTDINNAKIDMLVLFLKVEIELLKASGTITNKQKQERIKELNEKIAEIKAGLSFLQQDKQEEEDGDEESKIRKKFIRYAKLTAKFNNYAQELADRILKSKLEAIDTEVRAEEAKYNRLIELAEGDELQQASLREQKEASLRKLAQKRYKAEVAQFKYEQAFAITRIAIDLALEIAKNKGQTGTVFSIPLNAIAIASAVVQAATVAARKPPPPPAYKEGVQNLSRDEVAMINDGISKEYVERDGQILSTNQKNAIVELKKGDTVYKNYDDMFRKTLIASAVIEGKYISENEFNKLSDTIELSIEKGFKKSKINNTIKLNNIVHNDNYLEEKSRWN